LRQKIRLYQKFLFFVQAWRPIDQLIQHRGDNAISINDSNKLLFTFNYVFKLFIFLKGLILAQQSEPKAQGGKSQTPECMRPPYRQNHVL